MFMKKYLLIFAAALMVATGANAQRTRITDMQSVLNKVAPTAEQMAMPMSKTNATPIVKKAAKKMNGRRAMSSVAGTYILDAGNWDGDFIESTEFTIEEETGTITLDQYDDDPSFDYNVKLVGFGTSKATIYGFYDEEDGSLFLPVQLAFNYTEDGTDYPVVFTGLVQDADGSPVSYGYEMTLLFDEEDGTVEIYEGDFEQEIEDGDMEEGVYLGGFWFVMPTYLSTSGNPMPYTYGFDIEVFLPNAELGSNEVHIKSGAWGSWENKEYSVYVEDYGSEMVVHNFFGLRPISMTIDGDKATIATPVKMIDYDYADEGDEEPNYIQLWQWDETFENIMNPGAIVGTIEELPGGKLIRFYDTEYKEAWTDEYGDHEAGNYYITDYTKWFMVHSTWGENGAYWWGEARYVYIFIPNAEADGISDVNTNVNNNLKTFNLMGQQVKNAKGIVIRDGKKFVK